MEREERERAVSEFLSRVSQSKVTVLCPQGGTCPEGPSLHLVPGGEEKERVEREERERAASEFLSRVSQ